ncbi:hypothetical protein D3C78_1584110 [compost metagenome]
MFKWWLQRTNLLDDLTLAFRAHEVVAKDGPHYHEFIKHPERINLAVAEVKAFIAQDKLRAEQYSTGESHV